MSVQTAALLEHLALLFLLALIVSVVYNGLRREAVGEIVRTGIKRGLVFALVSLFVFGGGGYLLAQWL
jgi:hypothetical protein